MYTVTQWRPVDRDSLCMCSKRRAQIHSDFQHRSPERKRGFLRCEAIFAATPIPNLLAARKPSPSRRTVVLGEGAYGCRSDVTARPRGNPDRQGVPLPEGTVPPATTFPAGPDLTRPAFRRRRPPLRAAAAEALPASRTPRSGQLHLGQVRQVAGLTLRVAVLLLRVEEIAQGVLLRGVGGLENALRRTPGYRLGTLHLARRHKGDKSELPYRPSAPSLAPGLRTQERGVPSPKGNLHPPRV